MLLNDCFDTTVRTNARPSDRVRLKNAYYAKFAGQIVQLQRPIMR